MSRRRAVATDQLAVLDWDCDAGANEGGFDVSLIEVRRPLKIYLPPGFLINGLQLTGMSSGPSALL